MSANRQEIFLKDYQPYPFELERVNLVFDLADHATKVTANLQFRRKEAYPNAALWLDCDEVKLERVMLDGVILAELDYRLTPQGLEIANVPDAFQLKTEVTIDPKNNTKLMGLYKSNGAFCTQCESHGFRRITFFPDRPDVLTEFTVAIRGDKKQYPYLLSNGNLIEEHQLDDGRHEAIWHDPWKKPCYLFALVGGDFDLLEDEFITMSGRNVALKLFVDKGYADQGHWAMESLKHSMKWDEEVYGREYDLDIFMTVAVFDFNFGAMENKGLNIFNAKYILAKAATATDRDYMLIEEVVGHEYFHNWSGDRVTCRDWFQITLKEGLTVFRDQSFTADMTSQAAKRIEDVNVIRTAQFLQDAGPMAHPIQPQSYIEMNNFYTVTVYNKGSEVIRMFHTMLGKDLYRKATDLYFSRFDGQAVTTEDFVACMEEAAGRDFTQFRRWYVQAGTPAVDASDEYDAQNQVYRLTLKQSCAPTTDGSPKEPFVIPVSFGLLDQQGNDIESGLLELTENEQTFEFTSIKEKPVPSLLRNFSAPVVLNYNYSNKELAWLMANDNDAFNRWDASQRLAKNLLLSLVADVQANKELKLDGIWLEACRYVLANETDYQLAALSLTLPNENYLLQQMPVADPDAVHQAREFVRLHMAQQLKNQWQQTYQQLNDGKPYEYNVKGMGQRSLKNLSLAYLNKLNDSEVWQLAYQQFNQTDNMTDKMGALGALNNSDCLEREAALTEFYEEWSEDPLVVDKWFSLQAGSFLPNTLEKVKSLLTHPAYNAKNPNKIRALIGAFSMNQFILHNLSGEGYAFLADQVIAVDKVNPMTAARIVAPLIQWKRFDEKRQQLMQAQLEKILAVEGLSSDVYEVVEKALT